MGDRKTAVNFFNQGVSAINDKSNAQNASTAFQLFISATYADPTWWNGHFQVGNNNSDLKHYDAAVASYRLALQCEMTDQERGKVYANLSQHLHTNGFAEEALPYAEESCALDPRDHDRWTNISVIYRTLGDTKKSLTAATTAHDLAPDNVAAQMAYSFALLFDGQYQKGFDLFECRYRYALHQFTQFPYPRWKGERDCVLFLVADQGLGDTLSFARFIPRVVERVKFVHVACHGELMRAFQHAFRMYDNVDIIPLHPNFRQADYWSTFVSLPWALKLSDEEIRTAPGIEMPINRLGSDQWRLPDRKLHVGIAWGGSPLNQINPYRNLPLEQFFELTRIKGVQLYSLQVNAPQRAYVQELFDAGGTAAIVDLSPYLRDVVDTVSFLQRLDLVICCESALGHICASVGKECWIPLSVMGNDYRAGRHGEIKLWTPRHRFFLQTQVGKWDDVFDEIVVALQEKVDAAS